MRVIHVTAAVICAGLSYGQDSLPVKANVSPLLAAAEDLGAVEASRPMPRMSMRFAMTPAQQRDLEELLRAQQTRGHALYHRWLSTAEYADRFGVRHEDAEAVAAWLREAGFTDVEIAPSRTSVSFSGSAGQVEAALGASVHAYVLDGEAHIANASAPVLPSGVAGLVESIAGLHDFHPAAQHVRRAAPGGANPQFTDSSTGEHFLTPDDFATIYDVKPLYAAGIDGTGVKIAVVGESDIALADIRSFRSAAGLPQKDPVVVLTGPDPGTVTGPEVEADLDIEWAGAIAKNATIVYVNSTSAFLSAAYAVEHNLAPVLSISYGACEAQLGSAELNALADLFRQANAQGITVLASSGDTGAAACDAPTAAVATHGLAVLAPASIPYVTGVGGTTLLDSPGDFAANNNRAGGSARGYISEAPWNDTALYGKLVATGGGKSAVFPKPTWQAGPGMPQDGARDVPDVVLAASPSRVGHLICSQGSCVNGFGSASGTLDVIGGTSCGPPGMAAMVALLDQTMGAPQGNINPELYSRAGFSVFHVPALGSNEVPCTAGTPDCTGGEEGYQSWFSYSVVTGLGSVDAYALVDGWEQPAATVFPLPPLSNVFAGIDTSLWALNFFDGTVYLYGSQTQSWTAIAHTSLSQLMAISSDAAWARDVFDDIFRWDAGSQKFVQISAPVRSIAVGGDGDVWGIGDLNYIFHFDPKTQTWVQVPGQLTQIAVGFTGAVWGINAYGQIFRFNPGLGSFEYVAGSLMSISVTPDGGVWGLNGAGDVYHFDRLTQGWEQFTFNAGEAMIAAGSDTNVWATDHSEHAVRLNARFKDFYEVSANTLMIEASVDGSAVSVGADGQVYQLSAATETLESWHEIPGALAQLSAASDGNVWGVNVFGQIYTFDPLAQRWMWIPGTLAQMAVARNGAVWGVNPEGSVYRYDYAKAGWELMPGTMTQISVADNGDVWAMDAGGVAYRFNESAQSWTAMAGALKQLSVGADGAAWGVDVQGSVERFDAQAGAFVAGPGSMAQVTVGSNGNVWALDGGGSIYQFDAGTGAWRQVPGQLTEVEAAFDGSVWGINSQGQIWRFNAGTGSWDNIPGALRSLSLGCDAVVWGINAAGSTYYFQ